MLPLQAFQLSILQSLIILLSLHLHPFFWPTFVITAYLSASMRGSPSIISIADDINKTLLFDVHAFFATAATAEFHNLLPPCQGVTNVTDFHGFLS